MTTGNILEQPAALKASDDVPEDQYAGEFEHQAELARQREFSRSRARGYVIRCDGQYAVISAMVAKDASESDNYWAVGQLVSVQVGLNRIVGLSCQVDVCESSWKQDDRNEIHVTLELVGEIQSGTDGLPDRFTSGITRYPQMGCVAHRIRSKDLSVIYQSEGQSVVSIGSLTQDSTVEAKIDIDKLLSRHFAVVGTTGVGKSTSVTLILRKIIQLRPDIRIMIMDPHNEFATAFPENSVVVDSGNLVLPFWLFKLDEFVEVVFRGQKGFDSEIEILRDLIPLAKERYKAESDQPSSTLVKSKAVSQTNMTADTPLPYRMADLLKLIDERLGKLDGKANKPLLKSLEYRLQSISSDPRFRFMFDPAHGGDVMESIVSKLFRVPHENKPICVLEMSALPTEVVNSVASILCRMAFDLAMNSDGGIQTLVVCEEAHRYIPSDENAGFWPTRQAIARIAKEGRKYGVYLGIITQRPGELDPTILSQCNTLFSMRLGNQKDQEIIRGAVTNGAKSTIDFLSSIANRECIAFGEAIHTPMRMTFETMAAKDLPGAHIYEQQAAVKAGLDVSLASVLRKMREDSKQSGVVKSYELDDVPATDMKDALQQRELNQPREPGQPDVDINSIINAAYTPQKTSPPAPAPIMSPRPDAAPAPASASAPSPMRKAKTAGSLIKAFRSN